MTTTMKIGMLAALLLCVFATVGSAQDPNFRKLDANGDGVVEPAEIPTQTASAVARVASLAGLDMTKPMSVKSLETASADYVRNLDPRNRPGSIRAIIADDNGFGRIKGSGVRAFGEVGDLGTEFSESVRRDAIGIFLKFDANRDGLLSREEAGIAYKVRSDSWFRGDRNGNGLLTFMELAHHFAADSERQNMSRAHDRSTWNIDGVIVTPGHRRHAATLMQNLDKNKNGRIDRTEVPEAWKTGNELRLADGDGDGQITTLEMQLGAVRFLEEQQKAADRKKDINFQHCGYLVADILRRYDFNKDRSLSRSEWLFMGGNIEPADLNRNGLASEEELRAWLLTRLTSQAGANVPDGIPDWFLESDVDRDGQVLMSEFLRAQPNVSASAFSVFDQNDDGIVTPGECGLHSGGSKTRYVSRSPRILEARAETWSEIQIPDEITIADIDVQVSITKDGDDDIDLRLIGPDGTMATLYYTERRKAWGGGRLFENTLIDDEAPEMKVRPPRPPAHRSFRPQSMNDKKLLSLSAFYGKPARGTWRLLIRNEARNRGGGAGLLEGWSLFVKVADDESTMNYGNSAKK